MSETLTTTVTNADATSTTTPIVDDVPAHHANPIVAFIIGLSIVLLASILNAGGLNLTKLDHVRTFYSCTEGNSIENALQVRTSAIPKASRRKDWLRPLWLLGMILYM